jgi:membrane associated rhomboid family serine protease
MTNLLLAAGLWMAAVAGFSTLRQRGLRWFDGRPLLTVSSAGVIAATSLAQLTLAPDLLQVLMRTAPHVVAREPWRLATSLLVQDGGWAGFAFNLVSLLIIGSLAERLLGRLRWVIVGSVAVAATQAVALTWQPIGAGNSILNFGLAGGLCARGLLSRRAPAARTPAIVAGGCFAGLLLARDIHGVAAATGAVVACVVALPAGRPR